MLQSRAGCWSRMFPCSCLVFKSRLAPGAARAPRAARLSPAPCLCPACGWGGSEGLSLLFLRCPLPGLCSLGLGLCLGLLRSCHGRGCGQEGLQPLQLILEENICSCFQLSCRTKVLRPSQIMTVHETDMWHAARAARQRVTGS